MEPSNDSKEQACEVCRLNRYDDNIFQKIVCKICSKIIHKNCYAPDLREGKSFKCDECKKGKAQQRCFICNIQTGILKEVNEDTWVHVLCGLFSKRVRVSSFRALDFKKQHHIDKVEEKRLCHICKKQSRELYQCWVQKCENYAHVGCVVGFRFQEEHSPGLTYMLLNRHTNSFFPSLEKYNQEFDFWSFIKPKRCRALVCSQHHNDAQEFIYCPCGKTQPKREEDKKEGQQLSEKVPPKEVGCSVCRRWFHFTCSKLNKTSDQFICEGCIKNDYQIKAVYLSEMIQKLGEIQSRGVLDRKNLQFLNGVTVRLSTYLIKVCKENSGDIDRYYAKKTIERIAREEKYMDSKKRGSRSRTSYSVLYLMIFKQYRNYQQIKKDQFVKMLHYINTKGYGLSQLAVSVHKKILEEKLNTFDHLKSFDSKSIENSKLEHHSSVNISKQSHTKSSSSKKINNYANQTMQTKSFEKESEEQIVHQINHHDPVWQIVAKYDQQISYNGPVTEQQLAKQTKTFLTALQQNQLGRSTLAKMYSKMHPHIFQVLHFSKLSQKELSLIFSRFRLLSSLCPFQQIREYDYLKMISWVDPGFQILSEEKKIQLSKMFLLRLKGFRLKYQFQFQNQQLENAIRKITKGINPHQKRLIQKELAQKMIYLASSQESVFSEYEDIYYTIRKQKVLKAYSTPLSDQAKTVVGQLRTYIENRDNYNLTQKEKNQLDQYLMRAKFYLRVVVSYRKYFGLQLFGIEDEGEEEFNIESISSLGGFGKLVEKATQAMRNWGDMPTASNYAFKLLAQVPISKLGTLSQQQKQAIFHFAQTVLKSYGRIYQQHSGNLSPSNLQQICTIIKDAQLQSQFSRFLFFQQKYTSWMKELEAFIDIEEILQDEDKSKYLICCIENKLKDVQNIRLDLSSEIRKLKTLKIWAQFSVRFSLTKISKRECFSIGDMDPIMQMMTKIQYPNNKVRQRLIVLSNEAKHLLPKIKSFQRSRFKNEELWQQLKLITQKSIVELAELLLDFIEKSPFELLVQKSDLQDEIQKFQKIPQQLIKWVDEENDNLSALEEMRKKIVETPFRFSKIEEYQYLYARIYYIKCLLQSQFASQKEFNRMLTFGGNGVPSLLQKTETMRKALQTIEQGKKQLLEDKPRNQFLIPNQSQQLKQGVLREKGATQELQKFYNKAALLERRFYQLKQRRGNWDQFIKLLADIRRQPVALTELYNSILKLKQNINLFLQNSKAVLISTGDILSEQGRRVYQGYKKSQITHPELQKFVEIYNCCLSIRQLSKDYRIRSYSLFHRHCIAYQEVGNNQNVLVCRIEYFRVVHKEFMAQSNGFAEEGRLAIQEGGFLCYKFGNQANLISQTISRMSEIKSKLSPKPTAVTPTVSTSKKQVVQSKEQKLQGIGMVREVRVQIKKSLVELQESESESMSNESEMLDSALLQNRMKQMQMEQNKRKLSQIFENFDEDDQNQQSHKRSEM